MIPLNHKQLSGYSGAKLYLMSEPGRGYFLRKQAGNQAHSDRLRRQMKKQSYVYALPDRPFGVPEIYDSGVIDDCFYFDMEFVDGMDCPTFLGTMPVKQVQAVVVQIVATLRYFSRRESCEPELADFFPVLTRRILAVTRLGLGLPELEAVMLLDGLDRLTKCAVVAPTLSHGDLSLENILVARTGGILLIDFLDAPFCHYWQDVAKLWLDLEGHWYARRYNRISEWVMAELREKIFAFVHGESADYKKHHEFLVAINYMRILPYARTAEDRELLLHNINLVLNRAPNH